MKIKLLSLVLNVFVLSSAFAAAFPPITETASQYGVRRVYSTYSLTTSHWSPIIVSTPFAVSAITVFDSCAQVLSIGSAPVGSPAGTEAKNSILLFPGGGGYSFSIPSGSRVSYIAVSAGCSAANTENDTDFFI